MTWDGDYFMNKDRMTVRVEDDFDPGKICASGQCFRASEENGDFRFITKDRVLRIRPVSEDGRGVTCEADCSRSEWEEIWVPYFDLRRNYSAIRASVPQEDRFMRRAAESGRGIRILRQDPFETTISFIVSQRKNIPAIRRAVELLAERYGGRKQTEDGTVCLFPEPQALARVSEEELRRACGLGYRAPYVRCAALMVSEGRIDPGAASGLSDGELIDYFRRIKGVGEKVARCIALFAYGRTGVVPVDTWIARVMEEEYGGRDPFARFPENAGIFQQYAFYYAQHERGLRTGGKP
ncbi:MAG: DNA-3-methyladenine glycosylase 2 family protein [Lachnospiraceae bacterium]|jgi:N-glycosylase/DNA lyase|nr:DNA-3-methyladenine glycosylase 2 family protein [Lachnospiraceae bacterium]